LAASLYSDGLSIDWVPPLLKSRRLPAELVAPGVSAEVVVIVENENAGIWANLFAVEVSGCQPADAAATTIRS
jgi:hypothetical protein